MARNAIILLFPIFALVLFLSALAFVLEVNFLDSYEVLVNAKSFLGISAPYFPSRTVGTTALQVPLFWVEHVLQTTGVAYRLSYFLSLAFFSGTLLFYFRFARRIFSDRLAAFSTLLFAFTPYLIHYAPLSKVDIPALFFLTSGLVLLREEKLSRSMDTLCGCLLFLAAGTRYNFLPFLLLFLAIYGLLLKVFHRESFAPFLRRLSRIALVPLLLLGMIVLFRPEIPQKLVMAIRDLYHYNQSLSNWESSRNFNFLLYLVPFPFLLLAAVGARNWKDRDTLFLLVWITVFFVLHTYFLAGREVRFLFPLLVPLCLLATEGVRFVKGFLSESTIKWVFPITIAAIVFRGGMEAALFLDPMYRRPFDKEVVGILQELSKGKEVVWLGHSLGRHPHFYQYPQTDPMSYLFHFHPLSVFFHLNRSVKQLFNGNIIERGSPENGYWLKNIGKATEDGTVFIINPSSHTHFTHLATPHPKPIVIQRMRLVPYSASLPDGDYEAYVSDNGARNAVGIFSLRKGKLSEWKGKMPEWLLYFDKVTILWTT